MIRYAKCIALFVVCQMPVWIAPRGADANPAKAAKLISDADKARWKRAAKKRFGRRGAVAFATTTFGSWPLPAQKQPTNFAQCSDVHGIAYPPAAKGSYDVTLRVDGKECSTGLIVGGGQPMVFHAATSNHTNNPLGCDKPLEMPGKHTIAVEIWKSKYRNTNRWNINRSGQIYPMSEGRRVRKMAAKKVSCTTPSPITRPRFE